MPLAEELKPSDMRVLQEIRGSSRSYVDARILGRSMDMRNCEIGKALSRLEDAGKLEVYIERSQRGDLYEVVR